LRNRFTFKVGPVALSSINHHGKGIAAPDGANVLDIHSWSECTNNHVIDMLLQFKKNILWKLLTHIKGSTFKHSLHLLYRLKELASIRNRTVHTWIYMYVQTASLWRKSCAKDFVTFASFVSVSHYITVILIQKKCM